MKIAVVGCGAIGSYYGARLARDNHEVWFLLRSDYEVVRRHGVHIRSPQGDFYVRPRCAKDPAEVGPCDLVIIGLKTTANAQFPLLLPPLVDAHTALLTLQNGLGNEEALAKLFPREQVMGGLCFVCLNRIEPGVIHHIVHGDIMLGEFDRWPEPRTHDIASAFRHAGVPCKVSDNLARTHWEKLVWNIPFNGLGVAATAGLAAMRQGTLPGGFQVSDLGPCWTTEQLLQDGEWESLVKALMGEVLAGAAALGHVLPRTLPEKLLKLTREMGPYKASTLLDFEKGLPLELESLFLEPLHQAGAAQAVLPQMKALGKLLTQIDALRSHPK